MKRFSPSVIVFVILILCSVVGHAQQAPYKNPALPIDERVKDLMGRMTLEEKVAQMESTWQNRGYPQPESAYFMTPDGKLDVAKAKAMLKNGLGQVSRPSEAVAGAKHNPATPVAMAELTNQLQKLMLEDTRLGIPLIFHEECLHGLVSSKGTSYPQAIGLASYVGPGPVAADIYGHGARGPYARCAGMPDAGDRPGARSAVGAHGRDLWRRSIPREPYGDRGGERVARRGAVGR